MKQQRRKRSDYTEDTKPRTSGYARKKREGVEMNHKKHTVPVPWCSKCNK